MGEKTTMIGKRFGIAKAGRITATRAFDLEEIVPACHVVRVSVGPRFDPVILSMDAPPDYRRTAPPGVSYAKLRADQMNHFRIDHLLNGQWRSVTLAPTRENYHGVQPLGADEWLLVRGRAEGNADPNAHVYDSDGSRSRSFPAGDGIEDVQITEEGRIWVSYFDEGVFGDTALGQAGLTCLDRSGKVRFQFNELASAGTVPDIADCYALNVCSDREVWLCYYTDFPIVQLAEGRIAGIWAGVGVRGAHALAVSGRNVLLAGSYDKPNRLFLVDLDTSAVQERILVDAEGKEIKAFTAFGRGSRLWLQANRVLFVVELSVGPS
jgi:hypothetical protein